MPLPQLTPLQHEENIPLLSLRMDRPHNPGEMSGPSLGVPIASLAGFSPQDRYLAKKHPLLKEPFLSMAPKKTRFVSHSHTSQL